MKLRNRKRESIQQPRSADVAAPVELSQHRFDPRTDIPKERIDEKVRLLRHDPLTAAGYLRDVSDLVFLFPEMRDQFDIPADAYKHALERISEKRRHSAYDGIIYDALSVQLLSPEHFTEIDLSGQDYDWMCQDTQAEFESEFSVFPIEKRMDVSRAVSKAAELRVLFPDRSFEFAQSEDFFTTSLEVMEEYWTQGDYVAYLKMAGSLMILFPGRKSDFGLDQKKFAILRDAVLRPHSLFIELARHLTILSADDVVVTRNGIKLINNNDIARPTELPNRNLAV